jgi:hypothetical protein
MKYLIGIMLIGLLVSCGDEPASNKEGEEKQRKIEDAKHERDRRHIRNQGELDRRIKLLDACDGAGMSEKEIEKIKEENFNYDIIPKDADSSWWSRQHELWLD